MAERNQADVQGQGQGGPGDEEVLMELLRRLARGREEPKQEAGPRRMTRADRTQRINERRRAANAWGMSPAKRKYLQEQAEKRYQRRAEQKEEIRKRNLAKREAREARGAAMDAASAADREKAFKEVGERLAADRARREAFAEETYQRRRTESKAIGERKRAEAAARRERMAAAESARIAGLMEEGPRPGEMLRGGMPVSTPETRDFTDEVLRQRIQARARRQDQAVAMERYDRSMLNPRQVEAQRQEWDYYAERDRKRMQDEYERFVGEEMRAFDLSREGRGLLGGPQPSRSDNRMRAFQGLLDEMGMELVPKRAGVENLGLLERIQESRQGLNLNAAARLERMGRESQADLAYENLMGVAGGGQWAIDPGLLRVPSSGSEAMARFIAGRKPPLPGGVGYGQMGPERFR